jgi:hypothetical protein
MEKKMQNIKKRNLDVHTPKHNRKHQNKQGQQFQILIIYLNAIHPTELVLATNKNFCLISFGSYSTCTNLQQYLL